MEAESFDLTATVEHHAARRQQNSTKLQVCLPLTLFLSLPERVPSDDGVKKTERTATDRGGESESSGDDGDRERALYRQLDDRFRTQRGKTKRFDARMSVRILHQL